MLRWLRRAKPIKSRIPVDRPVVCPDCGFDKWHQGPEGGLSINISCGRCGARFNWTPFGLQRLSNSPYKR